MSNKHDGSMQAIKLRRAAEIYGKTAHVEPADDKDSGGRERWRVLARAAVSYARLMLAGQCIPIAKEPRK